MTSSAIPPRISIIINFYNMRREAERTLYSLSTRYQQNVEEKDYEVIAIDNGSSEPLDEKWVKSFGKNFQYLYFETSSPSPAAALNYAAEKAQAGQIMCCIDGARILSPGILKYTLAALKLHEHPFIYTMGMHIGPHLQNYSLVAGYNQEIEDKLLSTVDWRNNGYLLFTVSSIAESSRLGFYSKITESNCFSIKKYDYLDLGGLDERFTCSGGGVINHDLFNKIQADKKQSPIMLLGEATFHQFHGGVATNVPMAQHPFREMIKEYETIKGETFKHMYRDPEFYGWVSPHYHSKLMTIEKKIEK